MDGKQLQSQYKDHLSDFQNWDQRAHAQDYILYPKNMGYRLCIDETALSKGDLYTILINRDKRGRKGSIIAVIQGTKADDIIAVLTKMPQELRNQVKEITLDMAGSMQKIAKTCFPRAMQVIDRFHVQKLVYEAVQELRITYRWQVIKEENKAMKAAKECGKVVTVEEHSVIGGLGSAVCDVLCEKAPTPVLKIGVQDVFGESGPAVKLLEKYKLDGQGVYEQVKAYM